MIEDAILHPALPLVFWLTVASAGNFAPTELHVNLLLQIVYELAG